MTVAQDSSLRIVITKDRLRAQLVAPDPDPKFFTTESLMSKVNECSLPVSEALEARIAEIIELAQKGELGSEPTTIAEGVPPKPGQTAYFESAHKDQEDQQEDEEHQRTDFRQSHIVTVKQGDVVGYYTPEVPAAPGVDVLGQPLPGPKMGNSIQLGENVQLDDDNRTVRATCDGKVQITKHAISVINVVEIKGDVDYSSGNVDSPTDVLITGTVREDFVVKSAQSIAVKGAVEAAVVEAGTHVQVNGGITARQGGHVTAGGEICAKFCSDAHLKAQGDITITREVRNSNIHTAGQLIVERGCIIGGHAYARNGAIVKELGNDAYLATEIAVGVCPKALARASKTDEVIKKKMEAVEKIREKVQPLMAQLKRLTPQQRERATELLYEADNMEAEVLKYQQDKQKTIDADSPDPDVNPELTVLTEIFPGVTVIFGDKAASFSKPRRGPFKLVRRLVNRVEEIVLVDKISGSAQTLVSRHYEPPPVEEPEQAETHQHA
jgi:hypothetical protein